MNQTLTRWFTFSAVHTVDSPRCPKRIHGHRWRIGFVTAGGPNPRTGEFEDHLSVAAQFVVELVGENFNEVLHGVYPTAEGLAAVALERTRMSTPGLVRVIVYMDEDYSAEASI